MNRLLLAIGGLLVGLLALLFVAPVVVDWNRYRGIFEEEASRFLGRDVRVGGRVNLRLLPVPYVRFEKVRIADTTGNVGKPLFTADEFTLWLSVGRLLAGGFEASAIELNRPVVTLVLDGKGGGSWSSLAPRSWSEALGPSTHVSFEQVNITDGLVQILSPAGKPRAEFRHINGTLSASALEGPYKVAAAFSVGGAARELRLSTARPAEDGTVRLKGTVRDPGTGTSYTLDGRLTDVQGQTRLSGELTAHLPLPSMLPAADGSAPRARRQGKSDFDVRADLVADTRALSLSNLSLSFEQAGRPQLATGEARVDWAEQTDIRLALRSQWLDLDHIAGGEATTATPLGLIETIATGLARVLASEGRTEATLSIDQATLGGDVVSGLTATLEETKGSLAVRNFSAGLPGGTRFTATGAFALKDKAARYDGRINLRGASLSRFVAWAARGRRVVVPARDGAFAVAGDVTLGSGTVAGRNLSLEIGRNTLVGEASWKDGDPQQLQVALEGTEIDLTPVLDEGVPPLEGVKRMIAGLAGGGPGGAGDAGPARRSVADIRLRVDRLVAGRTVFRDAATELRVADGTLTVPLIRVSSEQGYTLDLRGDIADVARADAKGALTGSATATTPAGAVALAELLLPAGMRPDARWASVAVPLRLAGRLAVGARGPGTAELAADGTLGSARIASTLRLGAEPGPWQDRSADLAMTLEGADVARLVALARGLPEPASAPGRLLLRAIGTPRKGVVTLASVRSTDVAADYRGRLVVEETASLALDGALDIELADMRAGLAMLGIANHPGMAGPLSGSMKVQSKGGTLALSSDRMALAGTSLSGRLSLEPAGEVGRRVVGELRADAAGLPALLGALTVGSAPARTTPPGESGSPWSEAPLDLSGVSSFAGSRIKLDVGLLTLLSGAIVRDARLELAARPEGLDLTLADSKAMGGRASGVLSLDRAPAGARLRAEARLSGARVETLAPAPASAVAGGIAALSLKAESTALTPRGLIVGLAGTGELALDRAGLRRWSPAAVADAAEAIIALKGEIPEGALAQQLELALAKGGGVPLGSERLALKLADGTLRMAPLVNTTAKGRLTAGLSLDIDRQLVEADLQLQPRSAPRPPGTPEKPALPAVSVVYAGPLSAVGSIAPRLDFSALAREVAVRKAEREVAELERLRRDDEERVRQEAARLEEERRQAAVRAAEAAAAAAAAAAAGTPSAPPVAPPTPSVPSGDSAAAAVQAPGAIAPPAGPSTAPAGLPPASPAVAEPAAVPGAPASAAPSPVEPPQPRPAQRPRSPRPDPFRSLRDAPGGG